MAIRALIRAAPPLWPNTVTLAGSPPKLAMLSFTQVRAAMMSSWPALPESGRPGRCR
jgi:hypothetical protein